MSVKLSELLLSACAGLQKEAAMCWERGNEEGRKQVLEHKLILGVIAPALVEVVQNSKNTCSCACDCPECPHCHLSRTMKAAGVTCE